MNAITCHRCGVSIYGCMGSTSFPGGVPFENPRFHCALCTERLMARGLAGSQCECEPCWGWLLMDEPKGRVGETP